MEINTNQKNAQRMRIIALPYRSFKERIRITKRYERRYKITDLGGLLYMERKMKVI